MNLYMILYYYTGNSVIYQIEFMEVNMKIRCNEDILRNIQL